MITKFDKQNLKEIDLEIIAALNVIAQKHNINLVLGGGSYDSNNFSCRIKGATKASQQSAHTYHPETMEDVVINTTTRFKLKNSTFQVTRIDKTKRRYTILATNQNGTSYWFTADCVIKNRI